MADNNIRNSNNRNGDVQELLAMLDRMQNRPRVQEVEEAMLQQGRPDLARMDIYTVPETGEGFIPTVSNEKLADLLITPAEEMPPLQPQTVHKKAEGEKSEVALFYGEDVEDEDWEQLPPKPAKKQNPVGVLLRGAGRMIPGKGDNLFKVLGKAGFWMGLVASVLVAVLLVNDMKIAPEAQQTLHQELLTLYQDSTDVTVGDTTAYPAGMLASFKQLYDRNDQVKGWLSFHAEGKDFLNIEYPFVQGEDNTYYQNHDYDGNESDYGTLYVDAEARIEGYNDADRVLVIHSNATPDQTMLSSMNRLLGPVDYARAVPELTLSTLYRRDIYYVFAMVLTDGSGKDPFNPIQTEFASEEAFLQYVQSLCARSLFDYPVDIAYDDSIVLLTVPTGAVSSGLIDGHVVVAARRRRPGEMSVQANQIMKNKNAIMPYSFYTSRGKTPHSFFYNGQEPVDTTTTETPTVPPTSLENPHGTTSTTQESGNGNQGGVVINKDPSATGSGTSSATDPTATQPTASDPSATTPTESGATESGATESGATESGATDPNPTGLDDEIITE